MNGMKRKAVFLLLFAAFALSGCRDEEVIPEHDMVLLYRDFFYADGYVDTQPDLRGQTDSLYLYVPIIEKYGYTKEMFLNSVDYYLRNAEDFVEILKQVKTLIGKDLLAIEEEHSAMMDAELESNSADKPLDIEAEEPVMVEEVDTARKILPHRPVERKLDASQLRKRKTAK